jgi:hypothetical protein
MLTPASKLSGDPEMLTPASKLSGDPEMWGTRGGAGFAGQEEGDDAKVGDEAAGAGVIEVVGGDAAEDTPGAKALGTLRAGGGPSLKLFSCMTSFTPCLGTSFTLLVF